MIDPAALAFVVPFGLLVVWLLMKRADRRK